MACFADHHTICLAVGISLGMLFYHKTGWSAGGIITPGVIAMHCNDPVRVIAALAAGLCVFPLIEAGVRLFGLYGRQRMAAAMLMALVGYALVSLFIPMQSLWLGWVVPGLIGADIQRQGIVATLGGCAATATATAMAVSLVC